MHNHLPAILLGLTSTVAIYSPLPAQAEAKVYQEVSGQENLRFNLQALSVLESLGLSLSSVESTATPDPGYTYAFKLLPPSSNPAVRGTSFTFSYDDETEVYIPLTPSEEFAGRITFDVDKTKLALNSPLEFGGLSIAFTPDFEFFASDPVTTNLRLFDVESSGNPSVNLDSQTWTLDTLKLNFSQEFSDFLIAAGADEPIKGLTFAEASGKRGFVEVRATQVPEPSSALAILMFSATIAVAKRHRRPA
ncbi:PEP-CTERM sorting domain-containing protein [Nostoc commune]|uniref:PEP-CTERM sorting domain-containing protein n=1 Tax=Nostoc commune TaxID=1178 RepID=UPI0018C4B57A|nr:PEP-CTERM sorting domain-containing protein [Nostoc commune]MBG1264668.1 PEP-CTERM sorting domain-containing protein [Nostoc commune BAE]